MNGSGATIDFSGQSYNVDSTKLQNARNEFITHLRNIAGSGKKVFVNGVEYEVDSNKLIDAIAEIEAVLGNLHTNDSEAIKLISSDGYVLQDVNGLTLTSI